MDSTRPPNRSRTLPLQRILGLSLVGIGIVLVAIAGTYYGYRYLASQNLDRLIYQDESDRHQLARPTTGVIDSGPSSNRSIASDLPPPVHTLYPGSVMAVRLWADPRGTFPSNGWKLPRGFTLLGRLGDPFVGGTVSAAIRITIPALDMDAEVYDLELANLTDSKAYETPKFSVGHIPTTPNPGAIGNGWFFGHLESPIQGEGNVFSGLPKIPELLRSGEDVFVLAESIERVFIYQVTETDLIHEDALILYNTDDSRITLVTCFPRLKYDHRLLVTAKLIGTIDIPQSSAS